MKAMPHIAWCLLRLCRPFSTDFPMRIALPGIESTATQQHSSRSPYLENLVAPLLAWSAAFASNISCFLFPASCLQHSFSKLLAPSEPLHPLGSNQLRCLLDLPAQQLPVLKVVADGPGFQLLDHIRQNIQGGAPAPETLPIVRPDHIQPNGELRKSNGGRGKDISGQSVLNNLWNNNRIDRLPMRHDLQSVLPELLRQIRLEKGGHINMVLLQLLQVQRGQITSSMGHGQSKRASQQKGGRCPLAEDGGLGRHHDVGNADLPD